MVSLSLHTCILFNRSYFLFNVMLTQYQYGKWIAVDFLANIRRLQYQVVRSANAPSIQLQQVRKTTSLYSMNIRDTSHLVLSSLRTMYFIFISLIFGFKFTLTGIQVCINNLKHIGLVTVYIQDLDSSISRSIIM